MGSPYLEGDGFSMGRRWNASKLPEPTLGQSNIMEQARKLLISWPASEHRLRMQKNSMGGERPMATTEMAAGRWWPSRMANSAREADSPVEGRRIRTFGPSS